MVRERFDESFEAMREQSNRLAETERTSENFDEIVEQRVELDRLRDEVTAARKDIVSRYEPPAPDVVEAPRGYTNTKLLGKVAAAVSVVLLVLAGVFTYRVIRTIGDGSPIYLDDVSESLDGCKWTVQATVRNETAGELALKRAKTVMNRRFTPAVLDFQPTIPVGESAPVAMSWFLGTSPSECPTSIDQVDHGNLILTFEDGIEISRGL